MIQSRLGNHVQKETLHRVLADGNEYEYSRHISLISSEGAGPTLVTLRCKHSLVPLHEVGAGAAYKTSRMTKR